jgi:hypothetical protein
VNNLIANVPHFVIETPHCIMHYLHFAADAHHFVIDGRYFVTDGNYSATYCRYFVIDDSYFILDHHYSVIDVVHGPQAFGSCHPSFFLRQIVEDQQSIIDFLLSHQPSQKLPWTTMSGQEWTII